MVHRVTPYFLKVDSCLKLRKSYKQKAGNSYFWFAKTYKHEHQLIVPCLKAQSLVATKTKYKNNKVNEYDYTNSEKLRCPCCKGKEMNSMSLSFPT